MTREQIIKTMTTCTSYLNCRDCPYIDYHDCRQRLSADVCRVLETQEQTNEELLTELKLVRGIAKSYKRRYEEAIQDFVERLKTREYCVSYYGLDSNIEMAVGIQDIEEVMNEMIGEINNA